MKKLLLFIGLLWSVGAIAQGPPIVNRSGPAVTAEDARVRVSLNFYVPKVHGLVNALNGGLDTLGAVVYDDSSRHLWIRDSAGSSHVWTMILKQGDAGTGSVTDVTAGLWMIPNNITTTGTLNVDSATMAAYFIRRKDSTIGYVTPTQMNNQGFLKTIAGITAGGDLTGTYPNPTIGANAVTFTKFQQLPAFSFVANPTASPGNTQPSYFGYGLRWNNDTVKVDTTTLKGVFGGIGGGITQLTGDGTAGPGSGSQPFTLATVNTNVFGSNTVLKFSVNGKGLVVGATPVVASDLNAIYGFTPIPLTAISATSPIIYNNATGVISCPSCGVSGGGISSLNALTAANQFMVVGSAGTSFNIQDATATHTFNIPLLSGVDTGMATPAMFATWNSKLTSSLASANIFVGNGGGVATAVAMSGDATLGNTGALTLASIISAGSCTNCNITFNAKGQPTAYANGSGGSTTPGGSNTQIQFNNSGAFGGSANFTWNGTLVNITGALGVSGTVNFTGIGSGTANDSLLTINAFTGKIGWVSRVINFYPVQGLQTLGVDSFGIGGFLYKPDTLDLNYYALNLLHVTGKSTVAGSDSAVIRTAAGPLELVPTSAFGGGGGGAVSSVSNSDGTLTISPTTGAVVASLNLGNANTWTATQTLNGVNLLFGTNGASTIGNGTNNALSINTHQILSNSGLTFEVPTANVYGFDINSIQQVGILTTGQLQLNNYTTTTSFTGTAVGLLEFDATGHILTAALGTSTITLTGTSGGGLASSSFTFATTTNTANTALTIPGSGTTFTFTYNPAWDFIDKSLSSVTSVFLGTTMGNTTLTGTGNIGIGAAGSQSISSGTNNIGIGTNTNFSLTTATADISIGDLAGAADISGGQNVGIGVQALRNNTATQETAVGYLAMEGNTSGTSNSGFGFKALFSNTTGLGNTGIGNQALGGETISQHNTAVGWLSLATLLDGFDNTMTGFGSGSGLIHGSFNSGFGSLFMDFGSSNKNITGGGYKALAYDSTGSFSVVFGSYAASASQGVYYSVIIGDSALGSSFPVATPTIGLNKAVIIGAYNGVVNTPSNMASYDSSFIAGYFNLATEGVSFSFHDGIMIGFHDTTARLGHISIIGDKLNQMLNYSYGGGSTIATELSLVGYFRTGDQFYNTDSAGPTFYDGSAWHKMFGSGGGGSGVTVIGTFASSSQANGGNISGNLLTFGPVDGTNPGMVSEVAQVMGSGIKTFTAEMVIDGVAAGKGVHAVSTNTAFGVSALASATGGSNTGVGLDAGANISTGSSNTFVGSTAGLTVNSGLSNTGVGASALHTTTGSFNTALGAGSLATEITLSNMVAVGYNTLNADVSGTNNLAIGYTAMVSDTSGSNNIVIGNGSLTALLSGADNFVIGNTSGNTLTTGTGNVLMGYKIDVASSNTSNTLNIAGLILGQGLSTAGGAGYLSGTVGIGTTASTTAMLTLPAATSTVAPLLLTTSAGTNITSPSSGMLWWNGTNLDFRTGSTTVDLLASATTPTLQQVLTAGSTLTTNNTITAGGNSLTFSGGFFSDFGGGTWNPATPVFSAGSTSPLNDATTAASGTVGTVSISTIGFFGTSSLTATNTGVVYTNAYGLLVNTAPTAGTNVTITNSYALGVIGNAIFQNQVSLPSEAINTWQTVTTGTSSTINNTQTNWLLNLSSLAATFTVTLPSAPVDGQLEKLFFGGTISGGVAVVTSLTVSANSGQTITQSAAPTTAVGGNCYIYQYNKALTTWYRQQ